MMSYTVINQLTLKINNMKNNYCEHCENELTFVKLPKSNGHFMVQEQCLSCGCKKGTQLKRTLFGNFYNLPDADIDLYNSFCHAQQNKYESKKRD